MLTPGAQAMGREVWEIVEEPVCSGVGVDIGVVVQVRKVVNQIFEEL